MNRTIEVYVSTGAKNAMFTLRTTTTSADDVRVYGYQDTYVKNLSVDAYTAENLALIYTANMQDRLGKDFVVKYVGMETDAIRRRRGKLSANETMFMDKIEKGIVPWGKYKDMLLENTPDNYLLWLTDQLMVPNQKPMFAALSMAASGVADTKGLIEARQAKRDERAARDLASKHFGEISKRYTETLTVEYVNYDEDCGVTRYQFRNANDDILFHKGHVALERGQTVTMKFTVKFHTETQKGVKKTYINRPAIIA